MNVLRELIAPGAESGAVARWVANRLGAAADGTQPMTAIHHPLGFLCLPLLRAPDLGVCLHVWDTTISRAELTTSPIHAHSWDLLSYVLYGRVGNAVVDVTPARDEATHRLFEVHSGAEVDEIRATSRLVRHTAVTLEHTTAGMKYTLPSGVFHKTVISDGTDAATVVVGRTRTDALDMSLGGLHTPTHTVRRRRVAAAVTARAASQVAQRVNRSLGQAS